MIWVVNANKFRIVTSPINSLLRDIEGLKFRHFNDRINDCIEVPNDSQLKLNAIKDKILNDKKRGFSEQTIGNLMKDYKSEMGTLADQFFQGKSKNRGVNPNQFRRDLLQPIFTKSKKQIEERMERNKELDADNQYYKYTWSKRSKIWGCANMPIFLDMGQELLLIESDLFLRKVPRSRFIEYYSGQRTTERFETK